MSNKLHGYKRGTLCLYPSSTSINTAYLQTEAGGNDRHKSRSKPLPPRSEIRADRHSECVHYIALCSLVTIPDQRSGVQDSLIFVDFPMSCIARLAVG
jgi:hypothetical protein